MSVITLGSSEEFKHFTSSPSLSVVHFSADWAEQCEHVTEVLTELSKLPELQGKGSKFAICDAENLSDVSLSFQVNSVPTVILFKNGKQVDRIEGANAIEITTKVKSHGAGVHTVLNDKPEKLDDRLKALINKHKIMVFMKGNRTAPRCGFSRTLIQILEATGEQYETFDILTDEEVRQGLKVFSDWPTYPQLYVNGHLIGGLDIIKELQASGELDSTLQA